MDVNKLYECMQSAYRKEHSTETALLHVQNDILCAVDDVCTVVLVLIDLLTWFELYLSDQTQCVGIQGVKLSSKDFKYDVPQG